MMNNSKTLLRHAFTQILPSTGLITQAGGQWKLVRAVPGLESFASRTFASQEEAITAIADYYGDQAGSTGQEVNPASRSNVADLNRAVDPDQKKAV